MVSRRFLAKPLFAEPLVSGAFISITCFSLAWERRSVLFYWLFCISGRFVRLLFCNRIQPGCFAVLQEIALCRKKSHFVARNRTLSQEIAIATSCENCCFRRATRATLREPLRAGTASDSASPHLKTAVSRGSLPLFESSPVRDPEIATCESIH